MTTVLHNMIVLWNTSYVEAALTQLRMDGFALKDEDVARLSPLLYEHIDMLGRHAFPVSEAAAKGELRPLRNPASDESTGKPGYGQKWRIGSTGLLVGSRRLNRAYRPVFFRLP